jgi:hypothetical protein
MDASENAAILVLGMHRSGTSAVAGALRLLGVTPPAHLIPATPDNPSGFGEANSILGTNDWILNEGATTWYECLRFDSAALDARTRATALTFIMLCLMSEFNGAPLKLIKDPRICLLLDLWLPALSAAGTSPVAMLVLRSPNEVADSLAARERLPVAISAALWLRYMLAAEFATRFSPRHVVAYDDLLRDWRGTLELAGTRAGIKWPISLDKAAPRMSKFLDVRHRHFGGVVRPNTIGAMPFGVWLEEAYAALLALAQDGDDARQFDRLDRVHKAFLTWCAAHGRAWSDAFLHKHDIRASRQFEVPADWHRIARDLPNTVALAVE